MNQNPAQATAKLVEAIENDIAAIQSIYPSIQLYDEPAGRLARRIQATAAKHYLPAMAAFKELQRATKSLMKNFVSVEAYPEYIDGKNNDRFIDMAAAETATRLALKKAQSFLPKE